MAKPRRKSSRYQHVGFIPDVHVPYHDQLAWDLVMMVWEYFKPHGTVIGGDFLDNYQLSRHRKDPSRKATFLDGLQQANGMLRKLEKCIGPVREFVMGNHDNWFNLYLMDNAPEIYEAFAGTDLLELKKHGWNVTDYMDYTKIGEIYTTHDDGKAGMNAVRKALERYGDNIVINHIHRMEYVVETNALGKAHVAACFGWLGNKDYATYVNRRLRSRDWALGFGWGTWDTKTGWMYIQPVPMVNYTCCVNGKVFDVKKGSVVEVTR